MSARDTPQEHHRPLTPEALAGTSVWAVAQRPLPAQRRGRYLPASGHHPARMAPDLAAHIIHTYTVPEDLVVDPMCGIGTTLVEAVHAGRHGLGVDCEKRWATLAGQNLDLARAQGATGTAEIVHADARDLPGALPRHLVALAGTAALVLTSPPYGPATHAHTRAASTQRTGHAGVTHRRDTYADPADTANLANAPTTQTLIDGFTQILHAAAWLLHPTGRLAVTARPWRENGELIDLPSMIIDAAEHAGFIHTDRCVALLTGLRHGRLLPRPSFLQLLQLRRARTAGTRLHLIAHEDVLIFEVGLAPSRASALPAEPVRWVNSPAEGPSSRALAGADRIPAAGERESGQAVGVVGGHADG
jgi:hypothetical protein